VFEKIKTFYCTFHCRHRYEKVSLDIQMKYTNDVPVVVLDSTKLLKKIELPRVSPRLKEEMLLSWIQKNLNILYKRS